jgi:hypothetical protein
MTLYLKHGRKNLIYYFPQILERLVYDPKTNQWTEKKDMPIRRGGFSLGVINNKIYVISGYSGIEIVNVIDVYDPELDEWIVQIEIPNPRSWTGSSVVNNKIYIFGGTHVFNGIGWPPGDFLSWVEEFTPSDSQFSISPQDKITSTWGNIKSVR